jgi:hypothetical protein
MWGGEEFSRYHDYRVTPAGREEAERIRRRERELASDATLGAHFPMLMKAWMNEAQRRALAMPLKNLRAALDRGEAPATIGAAKDLVETACKLSLEHAGTEIPARASLPGLFKLAQSALAGDAKTASNDLARSVTAAVQRLAELRNAAGTGHGRALVTDVAERDARLAASCGVAISEFVLTGPQDTR